MLKILGFCFADRLFVFFLSFKRARLSLSCSHTTYMFLHIQIKQPVNNKQIFRILGRERRSPSGDERIYYLIDSPADRHRRRIAEFMSYKYIYKYNIDASYFDVSRLQNKVQSHVCDHLHRCFQAPAASTIFPFQFATT